MILKSDPNFEEKMTFCMKNDMRKLVNFNPSLLSLKTCTLMGFFSQKYVMFEPKKYRGPLLVKTVVKNDSWLQK